VTGHHRDGSPTLRVIDCTLSRQTGWSTYCRRSPVIPSTVGRVRFDPYANAPQWYQDVLTLAGHLAHGPLDASISQLVEVRVSQITGCAFCLGLHSGEARKAGVDQGKLDTLAGWREAPGFDQRERSALALAEAMTRLGDGERVDESIWLAAREQFDDEELAALLYLVGLINVWNRINVTIELPSDHELPKRSSPADTRSAP
jgi:AhpD family alkylhydroperoxidase